MMHNTFKWCLLLTLYAPTVTQLFIAGGYTDEMLLKEETWKNAYAHELAYHIVT